MDALAGRMSPDATLMLFSGAYTGLPRGELAGLRWIRTYPDDAPHIDIDSKFGARTR